MKILVTVAVFLLLAACDESKVGQNRTYKVLTGPPCSTGSNSELDNPDGPIAVEFELLNQFREPHTVFELGEPIVFSVSLENLTDASVVYEYTQPIFDFCVERDDSAQWSLSYGQVYAQVIEYGSVDTNQTMIWRFEWTGVNNEGSYIPSGNYKVYPRLFVTADNEPFYLSEPLDFEVR